VAANSKGSSVCSNAIPTPDTPAGMRCRATGIDSTDAYGSGIFTISKREPLELHHHRLHALRERRVDILGVRDRARGCVRLQEGDENVDQLAGFRADDASAEDSIARGIEKHLENSRRLVHLDGARH